MEAGPLPGRGSRGAKNQKRAHIFKIQRWMYAATGGPKVKWGGRAPPVPPVAMALYGSKIPGILKRINDGIACWMLCRGEPTTPYKRKSYSKHLQKFFHYQGQESFAYLFNLLFFLSISNKLTNLYRLNYQAIFHLETTKAYISAYNCFTQKSLFLQL